MKNIVAILSIVCSLCPVSIQATTEKSISLVSDGVVWTFGTDSGLTLKKVDYKNGKTFNIIDHQDGRPLFDLSINASLSAKAQMNDKGGYDWQPGIGQIDPQSFRVVNTRYFKIDGKDAIEFETEVKTKYGDITGIVQVLANGKGGGLRC